MQQFTILDSGKLSDSSVLRQIESLREDVPDLDETAVESHMMLFRTYAAYFTATGVPSCRCVALTTMPMSPRPSSSPTS